MANHFEYKGYLGSADVDVESQTLFGRLLYIQDVIGYSAASPAELETEFRRAVDDYLQTCEKFGDEPEKPCKGSFNVRVGPELHKEVNLYARQKDVSLNEVVCTALTAMLRDGRKVQHVHHHDVTVRLSTERQLRVVSVGRPPLRWENLDDPISH